MKILLVGEYSRLHNSLKEGLVALGYEVTLIATGDYFKDYPADLRLKMRYQSGFMKYLKVALYKLFGFDINSLAVRKQFFSFREQLKGYDVVQLINESPFGLLPAMEKDIIEFLKANNSKLFLLSCGTDFISVKYELSDALPYSIMNEFKNGSASENDFKFILKYTKPEFADLHKFVFDRINGVIASDMDYHLPLKDHAAYLGLIPNPVNTDKIPVVENEVKKPIRIFLGINRAAYHTKGIRYFEEALEIISHKYPHEVQIEIAENLPYEEYIEKYNKAHIVLDQVLGYDQGYNALEAMAKGKVVFTGAERAFEAYYKLSEQVAVNALPDAARIASDLEQLILDTSQIKSIGKNAREFIEQEHHYVRIAQKYIDTWTAN